jgi:hypothetical protein
VLDDSSGDDCHVTPGTLGHAYDTQRLAAVVVPNDGGVQIVSFFVFLFLFLMLLTFFISVDVDYSGGGRQVTADSLSHHR